MRDNYELLNLKLDTPFSAINWNNYENRPVINDRSRFCSDSQQDNPRAKCCMDGYSIEAVLDEIAQSPERDFLSGYPCVNGMELSGLADRAGFVDEFKEANSGSSSGFLLLTLLWEQPLGARKPECVTPMDLVARLSESVADKDAA